MSRSPNGLRRGLLAVGVSLLAITGSAGATQKPSKVEHSGYSRSGSIQRVHGSTGHYNGRNTTSSKSREEKTGLPAFKPTPPPLPNVGAAPITAPNTAAVPATAQAPMPAAVPAAAPAPVATPTTTPATAPQVTPIPTVQPVALQPPAGPLLQLGLYSTKGEAEWAWIALSRKMPDVVEQLSQQIYIDSSGAVLRVAVKSPDADGDVVCRKIINHGQGCFVVRGAIRAATVTAAAEPAPVAKPVDVAPAATPVTVPVTMPVTAPPAAIAPAAVAPTAAAKVATVAVAAPPVESKRVDTKPADSKPADTRPAENKAAVPSLPTSGQTLTTVVVPPASPADARLPQPVAMPVTVAGAGVVKPEAALAPPSRTLDGFFPYSPDDAKVLAEIERRTRRRGRIGAVLPGGGLEVTPAILTQPEFNICAVTFDDGPHRTITRRILEILNAEKVVATYFPIGNVAIRYPDIIRDWVKSGHEIGNHSYTHSDLRSMKPEQQRFEVEETNKVLRELGATSILFRPPYGRYNGELLKIVKEVGSQAVLWNVDTRDWKDRDPDKIVEHVVTAAGSGSVLLMHSTYATTADALPRVVRILRQRNCEFVTLSDWIARMQAAGELPVTNAALPAPVVTAHARN